MENKTILGIDTSTDNCSVALMKNGEILSERSEIAKSAHSEKLIAFISDIFNETGTKIQDINAIGVNIGPGSFTGLRIGLSVAKGLAFPNKIPVYGVKSIPTLIAENNFEESIMYVIKSHKNMVFYHTYTNSEEDLLDIVIEYGDLAEIINGKDDVKIVGNSDFADVTGKPNDVIFPHGKSVAKLVNENYNKLQEASDQDIEPYYLTSFQTKKWTGNKK